MILFISISLNSMAQEAKLGTGFSAGFNLSQYQRDFGLGLNLTSPFIVHDHIAARVRANVMWNEHADEQGSSTWTPYSNFSLGIVGVSGQISNFMRLYGEGGVIMLNPSNSFSTADYELGGYGLFGFEFFLHPKSNYFLELGGVGTGAHADKVEGSPIYSNGFMVNVGFRQYF